MKLTRETYKGQITDRPVKVLQFGEGNFLRAFVNHTIQVLNEEADFNGNVAVVQPIEFGMVDMLEAQDGLYHTILQGIQNGETKRTAKLIDCISEFYNPYKDNNAYLNTATYEDMRFVISNTTEAGIAFNENDKLDDNPPSSFPAKLTAWLYKRFQHFNGASDKGIIFIPCELINHNGVALKETILKYIALWGLEDSFKTWVETDNTFCNTLVDRIVPGFPRDKIAEIQEELGYEDQLVVEGELFFLWVIEGADAVKAEFPAEKTDLNVVFTDNQQPYRNRKVHILNGAHTTMVPVGLLAGLETVKEAMNDEKVGEFVKQAVHQEIIPTLDLSKEELTSFAEAVTERFLNPYIKHYLSSISLNSFPKFKTRVLPCVTKYAEVTGNTPKHLALALASYIKLYNSDIVEVKDNADVLELVKEAWTAAPDFKAVAEKVLGFESLWGENLNEVTGLTATVASYLETIEGEGVVKILEDLQLAAAN